MKHLTFVAIILIFLLTACARYPDGANPIISNYLSHTNAGNQKRTIMHTGIDIGGKIGTSILAAADGYVLNSWNSSGGGHTIIIDHGQDSDGSYIRTLYCHNDKNLVLAGDTVKRGQKIAELGDTGRNLTSGIPHLHFEVYRGVDYIKDGWKHVNPSKYLIKTPKKIAECFDPTETYPELPIKFTYPVECSS